MQTDAFASERFDIVTAPGGAVQRAQEGREFGFKLTTVESMARMLDRFVHQVIDRIFLIPWLRPSQEKEPSTLSTSSCSSRRVSVIIRRCSWRSDSTAALAPIIATCSCSAR